jgi:hypothetical protein
MRPISCAASGSNNTRRVPRERVDAEVLPELTADDLIGIGVSSIGHHRKLPVRHCGAQRPPGRLPRRQPMPNAGN